MTAPRIRCFCDGGARGNPGPAGAGAVLLAPDGGVLAGRGRYLGVATNNVAEYQGLLLGLELARAAGVHSLEIYLDSELVVRQLHREYRVKHPVLQALYARAQAAMQGLGQCRVRHVGRDGNRMADRLVNQAIDRRAEVDYHPDGAPRGVV